MMIDLTRIKRFGLLAVSLLTVGLAVGAVVVRNEASQSILVEARSPGRATMVVVGASSFGDRPADQASLNFPEAAIERGGTIYVANALGFTVEAFSGGEVKSLIGQWDDDKFAPIYSDIVFDSTGSLCALDASNAKIRCVDAATGSLLRTIELPKIESSEDHLFLASSLSTRGDTFLVSGLVGKRAGQAQFLPIGPSHLIEWKGGHWSAGITASKILNGEEGRIRDAVYLSDGRIAVLAGDRFTVIAGGKIEGSVSLGVVHGGGVLETPEGWVVGAYASVKLVTPSFQVQDYPIPVAPANVGHLSSTSEGTVLLTDTGRQVVYELADDSSRVLQQLGGSGTRPKIVAMAKATDSGLLLLDNSAPRLFHYHPEPGTVGIVAGTGRQGYDSPGPAKTFSFQYPSGMAVAPNGDVYISEANYRIIRLRDGEAEVFAGDIHAGTPIEGQHRSEARFGALRGLDVDVAGNLFVVDQGNHSVWRISGDGLVSRVMGTGSAGLWVDGEKAITQPLNTPTGVLALSDGGVLVADTYNNSIVAIHPDGRTSLFAGRPSSTHYQGLGGYSGDGKPAKYAALNTPRALASDVAGNIYVADEFNNAVRMIDTKGIISTVAGGAWGFSDDGSRLNFPGDVEIAGDHLYVADTGNSIVWAFPLN